MKAYPIYPIGKPGVAWGDAEKKQWLAAQTKKRDYFTNVVSELMRFPDGEVFQYGELDYRQYGSAKFPLFAIRSPTWEATRPLCVVTGGVHGYETSGVHGALQFAKEHLASYSNRLNVLVLPCISPWGYEMVHRWTPLAVDPNRQFKAQPSPGCGEADAAMRCISEHVAKSSGILLHFDLHETTDTDNTEFTPTKIARDGLVDEPFDPIPDGYYSVANSHAPTPEWHRAIVEAVEKVTHIAPPDEKGSIIGEKITDRGVITIDGRQWGLCGAHTDAPYSVTTEIYPDSPSATPEICNVAQCTVVRAGIDFALQAQK